ncbi:MAG: hypothetical protein EBX37_13270 [Alphaproteobacteria bacterium]|nr:hypothetical protein [Alphaproteobacteria bacterium]
MRALGLTGSPIPYVEVTAEEREWAADFITEVTAYASVVAFAPSPGGARTDLPDEHICNYRRLPITLRDGVIADIRAAGYLPVRFGTRTKQSHIYSNYAEIPGVLTLPDLSVRQLAACYAVIDRGTMVDTGDHHLMLACGGTVDLLTPPSTWFYNHKRHHYGDDAWSLAGEVPREVYHPYPRAFPAIPQ